MFEEEEVIAFAILSMLSNSLQMSLKFGLSSGNGERQFSMSTLYLGSHESGISGLCPSSMALTICSGCHASYGGFPSIIISYNTMPNAYTSTAVL